MAEGLGGIADCLGGRQRVGKGNGRGYGGMAEGLRGVWQTGGDGRGSGGGHGRGPGGLTVTSACLHSVVAAQSKLYIFVNLLNI